MAFENSLPAATPFWPYRVSYPGPFSNRVTRENFRNMYDPNRLAYTTTTPQVAQGPNDVTASGQSEQGATAGDFFIALDGVPCVRTTTAPRSMGWTFPWWTARFDATGVPAGVRVPDGAMVAIIDAYLRYEFVGGAPADMMGVWIGGGLDASAAANYRNNTPGGASPGVDTGGAGIFLTAGGNAFDYLCWGIGGAVTERVNLPLLETDWHVFRFVLVSAVAGGFASLSITVDGATTPFIERTYGTAATPVPYAANPAATGDPSVPAIAFTGQAVTPPVGWAYGFDAKFGLYLPDGTSVQDP